MADLKYLSLNTQSKVTMPGVVQGCASVGNVKSIKDKILSKDCKSLRSQGMLSEYLKFKGAHKIFSRIQLADFSDHRAEAKSKVKLV